MRKLPLSVFSLAATLAASPALAHHDDEHGLPGVLHPLSADHEGWILLVGAVLLMAFFLARPILKALKIRSRR